MELKKLIIIFLSFIFHFSSAQNIKIISFNLDEKLQNKKSRNQIIKLFKELNADIICLQEASQKNHLTTLAKKLDMNWNNDAWHIGGMTILSKFNILDYKVIEIPDSYYNAFVSIKIAPGIWVCSIHLNSENYLEDDHERLRELNFILKKIDELNTEKVILAGDFNSTQNSKVNDLLESKNYIDSHKNKSWSKGTWMPSSNDERIDRIHFKGNFKILDGQVIDHTNIAWLKNRWITGQDHRLIISNLSFNYFLVKKKRSL